MSNNPSDPTAQISYLEALKQRQNIARNSGIFNPFAQPTSQNQIDLLTTAEPDTLPTVEQYENPFLQKPPEHPEVVENAQVEPVVVESSPATQQPPSGKCQQQQSPTPPPSPQIQSQPEVSRKRRIEVHENVDNRKAVEKESIPVPTIQNVVATVDMCTHLRLREISDQTLNSEYNPHRFAALIMRIFDPKSTALIFSTGKMVVTGAKSAERCRAAAKKFAKIIRKLGYDIHFNNFQIQNIVGSVDLGANVKLEILAASQIAETDYEPELFPGLVYRVEKPKIVILVFVSGKIVLTGAKHVSEIQEAFNLVYPVIKAFTTAPRLDHNQAKRRNNNNS